MASKSEAEKNMEIELKPGEFLVKEKSPCDALYIIQEGQLEAFRTNKTGRIPVGIISSGEYVGEAAIFLDGQHLSNVVALTHVKALKLPKNSIDTQLKNMPSWMVALARGLVTRLHQSNELMRKNGWIDATISEKVKAIRAKSEDVKKAG